MSRRLRVLRPQLLGDLAYETLLADIIAGRLKPGQRLHLDELAGAFGISRTPVREALLRLAALGFVEVTRNSRTVVASWSAHDMRERAQLVGRITAFAALAPNAGMTIDTDDFRRDGGDVSAYLSLAVALADAQFARVGSYITRELVEPLRIFTEPDTMTHHSLSIDTRRVDREAALDTALTAFDANDSLAASDALHTYAQALALALTLPTGGNGPISRGYTPPESLASLDAHNPPPYAVR